jgi:MtaA/CmuA family methyltransferase
MFNIILRRHNMFKRHQRETMTPRERFMTALLGSGKPDRPPVANPTSIATVDSMKIAESYFPDAHRDPEKMACLAMVGHDELGFDTVAPYFSVQQEAVAFGCKVQWGSEESMPDIKENPYDTPESLPDQKEIIDHPMIQTVIGAIKLLKKQYGNEVAVIGKVMGPWTLSYHLYGVQRFLMDTILDPDKVRGFLQSLKDFPVRFALAQFEAGADAVTLADHATGDLVSPIMYQDFLLPIHREITHRIGKPMILHICGRTTDRLSHIAETGFTAFHIDTKNNLNEATTLARKGNITLAGYINNPEVLYQGTPEEVKVRTKEAIQAGIQLIGPECAIPLKTPNRNLRAIVDACREYAFG